MFAWQDARVMRTLVFILARRVVGLVGCGPGPDAKDVEIAVLRHQLRVLRRRVVRRVCCIERSEAILTEYLTGETPSGCLSAAPTRSRRAGHGALGKLLTANLPAKITCDRSMQQTPTNCVSWCCEGRRNLAWGNPSIQGELTGPRHLVAPSWPPHRAACTAPAGDGTLELPRAPRTPAAELAPSAAFDVLAGA
jgi:hypothetical protein